MKKRKECEKRTVLIVNFTRRGVAKVSCYRRYRRRHALITKSPRDDKVIIERKKKESKARRLQHYIPGISLNDSVCWKCVKEIFLRNNGEAKFIWRKIYIFRRLNPQKKLHRLE